MDNGTRAGTVGGTMLAFISNIHPDDILKTVILTMVGAVVSFLVSLILQCMVGWVKRKRRDKTPG
jgi:mannitol-specific phosphotransferase system IIBC component